ncbi:hypothetical protein RUND412_005249 [Rhizina undulata]
MSDLKSYTGGCHCKSVQYTIQTKPLESQTILNCNCSICEDRGQLIVFVDGDKFSITAGEDLLKTYSFNKKTIRYRFCPNCGSHLFGHGEDNQKYGVNVRSINGVDLKSLTFMEFDGRSV